MPEREDLQAAIRSGFFAQAAQLATALGEGQETVSDLQLKAIWQIAANYRNQPGTRQLADRYGLSREAVIEWLRSTAAQKRASAADKADGLDERFQDPCYDQSTGRHLGFEDWLDQLSRNWNRLTDIVKNR